MNKQNFVFNSGNLKYTEKSTGFTELELNHFVIPLTEDEEYKLLHGKSRLRDYLDRVGFL